MRVVFAVMVAACSTPAKHDQRVPPPIASADAVTPSDAQAPPSDADVARDPEVASDPQAVRPPAVAPAHRAGFHFDWQRERDAYNAMRKSPPGSGGPCDMRVGHGPKDECYARNVLLAALGHPTNGGDSTHTVFRLDRGEDDGVRKGWFAAMLDKDGVLASPWGQVTYLQGYGESLALIEITPYRAINSTKHIVIAQHPEGTYHAPLRRTE